MTTVKLSVNGREMSADVEGRTLLVELLREHLGLTGTHVGCDTSQCGACTVHMDGKSVKSCSVLAMEVAGAEVTTIEGMANPDGSLSVIQAAFKEHHGLQCGFCTPGMVMIASALLKENPKPTEAEVRAYLEGNIYIDVHNNPPRGNTGALYFCVSCINSIENISSEELDYLEITEGRDAKTAVEILSRIWGNYNGS